MFGENLPKSYKYYKSVKIRVRLCGLTVHCAKRPSSSDVFG